MRGRVPGRDRKEDVRATEKDKVVLGASFVPGDVVRACVVRSLSAGVASCVLRAEEKRGKGKIFLGGGADTQR